MQRKNSTLMAMAIDRFNSITRNGKKERKHWISGNFLNNCAHHLRLMTFTSLEYIFRWTQFFTFRLFNYSRLFIYLRLMTFTSLDNILRWTQFPTFRLFKFKLIWIYRTARIKINDIDTFAKLQEGKTEWNFRKTAHQT